MPWQAGVLFSPFFADPPAACAMMTGVCTIFLRLLSAACCASCAVTAPAPLPHWVSPQSGGISSSAPNRTTQHHIHRFTPCNGFTREPRLPQGGVGDVLRALGGGVVLESLVVAGAARREAREGSHGRRAGKRAPFGTSSIRRAHGRRRRRAEPIASLCNSREPIDARTGSCRRSGSWCI